ncbi:MAG: APC family permease [Acetobacterium woodii]|nr:APC family permease [Acetobacterium woodii]
MKKVIYLSKVKNVLLGKSLRSDEIKHERLSRRWGLPILASDAVSSVAYAVEEILIVLVPLLGFAAFGYVPGVVGAIILLLLILVFSYSQIISHYPNGGGAYIVSKENLGEMPALVSAAALMVDYILTVAVSISASTMAIVAAVPSLGPFRVEISVACILLITLINLRGMRESSKIFGIPTYAFIIAMCIMIAVGFFKLFSGTLTPITYTPDQLTSVLPTQAFQGVLVLLVLRAFSSGCSALTGVEAVSNAVPAFKEPSQRNAKHVLYLLAGIIVIVFGGTTILAVSLHVVHLEGTTVVAQIAQSIFGRNFFYYIIQITTSLILILAANTAYNGLPLLLYLLAHDHYVPRQFSQRGAKLSFSNGILFIMVVAIFLVVVFHSDPHNLIPLYSVGVFISFTLSQYGMFRKWLREKEKGWRYKSLINMFGAIVTGVGSLIIFYSKFFEGAWMLAIAMPIIIYVMIYIRNHYAEVKKQLELTEFAPYYPRPAGMKGTPCIVLLQSINKATLKALNYANTISDDITVLHICRYPKHAEELRAQWAELQIPLKLKIIENPYRDITRTLKCYVYKREKDLGHGENLTVILIKYVANHWFDLVLHNQTTYFLEKILSRFKNVTSVIIPYHYSLDSLSKNGKDIDEDEVD